MVPMIPRLWGGKGGRGPLNITTNPSQTFAQLLKQNEQLRVSAAK